MIFLKTDEQIELMRESNMLVAKTLGYITHMMKPGIKTLDIDKKAEEFIRDNGAEPGFKGYNTYPNTLCISVNNQIVHGLPSKYELKDGDIVSVDCGTLKNGFYGDSAYTFPIGNISDEVKKLLDITKECLYFGIEQAIVGARIGDISNAIQTHAEKNGFTVVRELVGHGIGKGLHEKPEVPNYGRKGVGTKLKKGLVIAIEPMINMGKKDIKQASDGWTICTSDNKLSAHYEHTVAIKPGQADILSSFEYIENELKKLN
jgi:methionyl aminopeptidase